MRWLGSIPHLVILSILTTGQKGSSQNLQLLVLLSHANYAVDDKDDDWTNDEVEELRRQESRIMSINVK